MDAIYSALAPTTLIVGVAIAVVLVGLSLFMFIDYMRYGHLSGRKHAT